MGPSKEQQIADIIARIEQSPITDENGKAGVLMICNLSDGRRVGINVWGADNEARLDLTFNHLAHSVLFHEEQIAAAKGGAV